jgi:hypothetical protein
MRKDGFLKGKYNKLKMKKIRPCNILKKFATNSYEIELSEDIGISSIFNVADLIYPYRMDDTEGADGQKEIQWKKNMPILYKPQIEKTSFQTIAKKTKRKTYYDYLVKWKYHLAEDVSWITETDIQKHGKKVQDFMERSP